MSTAASPLTCRLTAALDMAQRIHHTKRIKGTDLSHLLHALDASSTPVGSTGSGYCTAASSALTWSSPGPNNGSRLDHAFLSPSSPTPTACRYGTRDAAGNTIYGPAHARVSGSAAMIIDFPFERLELHR